MISIVVGYPVAQFWTQPYNTAGYIMLYPHDIHETNPIHIWLVIYLPLWKIMEFVSWDYDIPNWMESHKIHSKAPRNIH